MSNVSMIDGHIDNDLDNQKMTDDEIIRLLGDIVTIYAKDATTIYGKPVVALLGDALSLINRQNAEIESLTEKIEALGDPLQDAQWKIAEQQAEIERLQKVIETMTNEQLQR